MLKSGQKFTLKNTAKNLRHDEKWHGMNVPKKGHARENGTKARHHHAERHKQPEIGALGNVTGDNHASRVKEPIKKVQHRKFLLALHVKRLPGAPGAVAVHEQLGQLTVAKIGRDGHAWAVGLREDILHHPKSRKKENPSALFFEFWIFYWILNFLF